MRSRRRHEEVGISKNEIDGIIVAIDEEKIGVRKNIDLMIGGSPGFFQKIFEQPVEAGDVLQLFPSELFYRRPVVRKRIDADASIIMAGGHQNAFSVLPQSIRRK